MAARMHARDFGNKFWICRRGFYLKEIKNRLFHSFGLKDILLKRLKDMNIEKPTAIQEKALGTVMEGKDVVINAETGSGKTLCYLLPIINKLLVDKELLSRPPYAVVLLPSIELCHQVASVFRSLAHDALHPCIVHRESKLMVNPDYPIIVATANSLCNYRLSSLSNVQVVVIDEADLLLTSGGNIPWEILSFFKGVDSLKAKKKKRHLARQQKASRQRNAVDDENVTSDSLRQIDIKFTSDAKRECCEPEMTSTPPPKRQFVFVAATLPHHGPKSAFSVLKDWVPEAEFVSTDLVHQILPTVDIFYVSVHEAEKLPALLRCLNSLAGLIKYPFAHVEKKSNEKMDFKFEGSVDFSSDISFGKDTFKTEKMYLSNKKTEILDAHKSKLKDRALEERDFATSFGNVSWENLRVLVFVNSARAAEQAFNFLSDPGEVEESNSISWKHGTKSDESSTTWQAEDNGNGSKKDTLSYFVTHTGSNDIWIGRVGMIHKKLPLSQRTETLNKFKSAELKVLICTDLASRGLDIQDVSHVIQLDFAPNAAHVLHRTGRTARAGASGRVINFVTKDVEDLATALQAREDPSTGGRYESHFSRQRQFRRRLKKKLQGQLKREAKDVCELK